MEKGYNFFSNCLQIDQTAILNDKGSTEDPELFCMSADVEYLQQD